MEKKIQLIVDEIRNIALEIAQCKDAAQIMALHQKIQQLFENSIAIKTLYLICDDFGLSNESHSSKAEAPKVESETFRQATTTPTVNKTSGGFEVISFEKPIKNKPSVEEKSPPKESALKKLIPLQVSLNDKVAFISYLFGNIENTNAAIDAFNQLETFEESMEFIDELAKRFDWKGKEEYINRLRELVLARFSG